jgi:uncharacterized membrane protein YjdF
VLFTWLAIYLGVLAWSGIGPKDRLTWVLEVAPAAIGLVVLAATRRRYPLTPLAYLLVLVHAVILMVGGHYTYAEVPLFDHLAEWLGHARNNYDTPATTTTSSATSRRASCRHCWRARSCCAPARCAGAAGSTTSW